MQDLVLVIACKNKNCREVFRLQYSSQKGKVEGLPQSSKGTERANFWCWICGTVFPCTVQDCRWEDTQKLAQGQRRGDKAAFRTGLQCAQENCKALVVVNTITDDGPNADELRKRAVLMKGRLVCQEGHEFSMQPEKRDLHFYRIAADQICTNP